MSDTQKPTLDVTIEPLPYLGPDLLNKAFKLLREFYITPKTVEDLAKFLQAPHQHGFVVKDKESDQVVGCYILSRNAVRTQIDYFALKEEYQQQGIGTQIINALLEELPQQKQTELVVEIPEQGLIAQKLAKKLGFIHIKTIPNHYEKDGYNIKAGDDAYQFKYSLAAIVDKGPYGNDKQLSVHYATITPNEYDITVTNILNKQTEHAIIKTSCPLGHIITEVSKTLEDTNIDSPLDAVREIKQTIQNLKGKQ